MAKDADVSAVRTAHRKLVLKFHPDRIQDPALKEKGKDAFQKIQQAYEILSDPVRRSRYDDKIKLAELRREAMMARSQTYPTRPSAHSASSSREFNAEDQTYYETRRPRESEFDSKEKFEPPNRTTSRKHAEYERGPPTKKPERSDRSAKAAWGAAAEAVKFGIKVKKEAEKTRASKAHQSSKETRDREKRQARSEKDRRAFVVDQSDSDSDTATRVTASTVRPSKSVPRPDPGNTRNSDTYQRRAYTDDDSDTATYVSSKWERSHLDAQAYMQKAAGGQPTRPSLDREDSFSFWGSRRGASDSEKRPTSSRGRRGNSYQEDPIRPPMHTQTSAPGNLKNHVDERSHKDRRSATGSYPDHRKEMPTFPRSNTMPSTRPSSRRDPVPPKSSHLKHTETQDSGYGSSSSPHTPEMREESPPRRPKPTSAKSSSTKYKIVDAADSDDDKRTQIRVLDEEADRRRFQRSPEHEHKESDRRREKERGSERPRMETRSKTTRDMPADPSKARRTESGKYREEPRSPREPSSRATPTMNRHGSGRERERGHADVSSEEHLPYRSKYPSGDKINSRSPYAEAPSTKYRDAPDRRDYMAQAFPSARRTSIPSHA